MLSTRISLQDIAERYEGAHCIRYGRPTDWDVSGVDSWWGMLPMKPPRPVVEVMAASLCEDCPLLAMCAADALVERPVGVIRAGVAVTSGNGPRRWHRAVWRAVAAGSPLRRALAGISPSWNSEYAYQWISKNRPWGWGDLARLPRRARIEGARPNGGRGTPAGKGGGGLAPTPKAGVARG